LLICKVLFQAHLPSKLFFRHRKKAKLKARDAHHKIILIDGLKLVDLMHKYNVGVQIRSTYEVKAIDNDFFDSEEL
jgi:restriction system protein